MGPWDIIGWVVIIAVVLLVLLVCGGLGAGFAVRRILHLQDRDTPPEVGQRWLTANRSWPQPYEITAVDPETGRVHYQRRSTCATRSGGWSADEFRNVIYNTGAWLER